MLAGMANLVAVTLITGEEEFLAFAKTETDLHRNLGEAENTAQYATQLTTIRFLSVSPLKRSKLPPGLPISRSY